MTTTKPLTIPDPVDLDRVATFIAEPVFDDLFEVIVRSDDQPGGQTESSEDSLRDLEFSPKSPRHRLRTVLVAAGVIALLAAGLTTVLQMQPAQNRPGVRVTSWSAARPVPATAHPFPKNQPNGG